MIKAVKRRLRRTYTEWLYRNFRKEIQREAERHITTRKYEVETLRSRYYITPPTMQSLEERGISREEVILMGKHNARSQLQRDIDQYLEIEVIENCRTYPNIEIHGSVRMGRRTEKRYESRY